MQIRNSIKGTICDNEVLDRWHSHIIVWSEKISHNIHRIKTYTSNTNVEDITMEKYV